MAVTARRHVLLHLMAIMLLTSVASSQVYITDLTVVEGEDAPLPAGFAVIRSALNEGGKAGSGNEEMVVNPKKITFEQASQECQALENGHLVVILDQAMQDRVEEAITSSALKEPSMWIGMSGTGNNKKFDLQWVDGTPYQAGTSFNNFHTNEPNENGPICILAVAGKKKIPNGKWIDGGCQLRKPFICTSRATGKNHFLAVKEEYSSANAITDIVVLHGTETNVQVPAGYQLIKTNLNMEDTGDYIYAAFTRDPSKGEPIEEITVLTCDFNNADCHCFDVTKIKIPTNLNIAEDKKFVFLCYRRSGQALLN